MFTCNLCNSDKQKSYLKKEELTLYKCKTCGLISLNPIPEVSYEEDYFDNYSEQKSYLEKKKTKALSSKNFLKLIKKHYPYSGNILEIGCAAGFFLEQAKKEGFEPCGVETSEWARDYAGKELGITTYSTIEDFDKRTTKKMDSVVLLNTIEHLPDPNKTLKIIHDNLSSDGCLLITTPNMDNIKYAFKRAQDPYICKFHNYYFTTKTLRKILENNGFTIVHQRCPYLTRMGDQKIKSVATKKAIMKNPLFKIMKKFDNTRYGTTIEVIAKKR